MHSVRWWLIGVVLLTVGGELSAHRDRAPRKTSPAPETVTRSRPAPDIGESHSDALSPMRAPSSSSTGSPDAWPVAQTSVPAPPSVSGAGRHVITELVPLTQYQITENGTVRWTRVSSSQGVLSFDSDTDGPFDVAPTTSDGGARIGNRYTAMVTPAPGETFLAPAELRLVGFGFDLSGGGPGAPGTGYCLDRVEFYVDDAKVGTIGCVDAEFSVFKTRVSGIAEGAHAVWMRGFAGATFYDSKPRRITVLPPPTYSQTITLTADLDLNGRDYVLSGSPEKRIKVIGNGHSIVGSPSSFSATYVDFLDLGDRIKTAANGIDITTGGDVTVDNCRFYANDILAFTTNGDSAVTITNNLFSSNSRQPLGQYPDAYTGGLAHGSWPALLLAGSSSGAKLLQTNNFAAGWVDIRSPNWTIGGATAAEGNVAMGARVGFYVSQAFTGTISHNYSLHMYYGGWSQASNFELGNIPGLVIEHNVIEGSSWNVRGLAGEFRYNLVTGGGTEGFVWTQTAGPPNIHHNVFWGASVTRGAVFQIYGVKGTLIRNNTFDMVNKVGEPITLTSGSATFSSNLVMHHVTPSVQVGTATVTADYNAWFDMAGAHYSDSRNPMHDMTGNPGITGPPNFNPFSWEAVWNRTKTVSQILADFRTYYMPSAVVIDMGETTTYGAGNDIGAVGAGVPNANDRFGK
jgi:hypothetical protein